MKDTTSSRLNVKGPKQADALHRAEMAVLRGELKALPEGLREDARVNYLLDQNIKRKNLQDFQCSMISKVEAILKKNIMESGQNYRKYKVGGYDKGTYGKHTGSGLKHSRTQCIYSQFSTPITSQSASSAWSLRGT